MAATPDCPGLSADLTPSPDPRGTGNDDVDNERGSFWAMFVV